MTVTTADTLTDEQQTVALREHLAAHQIGADERWDIDALQALHDLAHA